MPKIRIDIKLLFKILRRDIAKRSQTSQFHKHACLTLQLLWLLFVVFYYGNSFMHRTQSWAASVPIILHHN